MLTIVRNLFLALMFAVPFVACQHDQDGGDPVPATQQPNLPPDGDDDPFNGGVGSNEPPAITDVFDYRQRNLTPGELRSVAREGWHLVLNQRPENVQVLEEVNVTKNRIEASFLVAPAPAELAAAKRAGKAGEVISSVAAIVRVPAEHAGKSAAADSVAVIITNEVMMPDGSKELEQLVLSREEIINHVATAESAASISMVMQAVVEKAKDCNDRSYSTEGGSFIEAVGKLVKDFLSCLFNF